MTNKLMTNVTVKNIYNYLHTTWSIKRYKGSDPDPFALIRSAEVNLRLRRVQRFRPMPNVLGTVKHTECQTGQKITWRKQARNGSESEPSSTCKKGGILINQNYRNYSNKRLPKNKRRPRMNAARASKNIIKRHPRITPAFFPIDAAFTRSIHNNCDSLYLSNNLRRRATVGYCLFC